jgi:SagB-type dehydrogenase family enzyme
MKERKPRTPRPGKSHGPISLPVAQTAGGLALTRCLAERRSVREFTPEPLPLAHAGQLLWAAQGLTDEEGFRTAPSAGALYPLELLLAAGDVEDLSPGVYRYEPEGHTLLSAGEGDRRLSLGAAAFGQTWIADAPAILAVAAVFERTTVKYGTRGARYVLIEAGNAAENICLHAVALGLGSTVVGAFDDEAVAAELGIAPPLVPIVLLPVGWPAG